MLAFLAGGCCREGDRAEEEGRVYGAILDAKAGASAEVLMTTAPVRNPTPRARASALGLCLVAVACARDADRSVEEGRVYGAVLDASRVSSAEVSDETLDDGFLVPKNPSKDFDQQAFDDFDVRSHHADPLARPRDTRVHVTVVASVRDEGFAFSHVGFDPGFQHAVVLVADISDGYPTTFLYGLRWSGSWKVEAEEFVGISR